MRLGGALFRRGWSSGGAGWPLRLAGVVSVASALLYLGLAPVPPATDRAPGPRPRVRTTLGWEEYRGHAFVTLVSSLDRGTPEAAARGALAAFRERDFVRVLAHSSTPFQRRWSPALLAQQFSSPHDLTDFDAVEFHETVELPEHVAVVRMTTTRGGERRERWWELTSDGPGTAWVVHGVGPRKPMSLEEHEAGPFPDAPGSSAPVAPSP